jgi:hypothetical protein
MWMELAQNRVQWGPFGVSGGEAIGSATSVLVILILTDGV